MQIEAVDVGMRCLEFSDDRGDVDPGGAIGPALVAVETGVGDVTNGILAERTGVEPPGEQGRHQIGLRAGRCLLRRILPIHRTHPHAGRLAAAGSAAVAGIHLVGQPLDRPCEHGQWWWRGLRHEWWSPARGNGRSADDHAGIQGAERIENPLDRREHTRQFRKVRREEGGSREGEALLGADGAAHGDDVGVDGVRQPLEPRASLGIARVGVGPHVQLAMPGMRKEHRRGIALLEHRLQPSQEIGQRLGRHYHIFQERHRADGAADSVEGGNYAPGQFPQHGLLGGILGPADVDAQRSRALQPPRGLVESSGGGLLAVAGEFHKQPGVGD